MSKPPRKPSPKPSPSTLPGPSGAPKRQLGWLDANVLIHPLFENDPESPACRQILQDLEEGRAEAWIDVLTVHEVSYTLLRVLATRFPSPREVVEYLASILLLDAVRCPDKEVLLAALQRWAERGPKFGGFADAWLAVRAQRSGLPVCSVNGRDFPDVVNTYPLAEPGPAKADTP